MLLFGPRASCFAKCALFVTVILTSVFQAISTGLQHNANINSSSSWVPPLLSAICVSVDIQRRFWPLLLPRPPVSTAVLRSALGRALFCQSQRRLEGAGVSLTGRCCQQPSHSGVLARALVAQVWRASSALLGLVKMIAQPNLVSTRAVSGHLIICKQATNSALEGVRLQVHPKFQIAFLGHASGVLQLHDAR